MKKDFRKRAVAFAVVASMAFPDCLSAFAAVSGTEENNTESVYEQAEETADGEENSDESDIIIFSGEETGDDTDDIVPDSEAEAEHESEENSDTDSGDEDTEGSGYGEGYINGYIEPEYQGNFVPDKIYTDDDFPDQYTGPIVWAENDPKYTDHTYSTSVKDQGRDGVCWAFAAIADYESALLTFLRTPFTGDDQLNLSESHLRYAVSSDGGNIYSGSQRSFDGGGNSRDALKYFTRGICGGPVNDADDPYSDYDTVRPVAKTLEISEKRIGYYPIKWETIGVLNKNNADYNAVKAAIKKTVYETGAAECSYYSDQAKYKSTDIGNVYYSTTTKSNHGVTVVGWDDSVPASYFKDMPPGDGAWLIKNSWGTSGSGSQYDGYFWMSYYTPCTVESLEKVRNFDFEKEKIYEYDNLGTGRALGISNDCFGYNRYSTGESTETLKSMGFSTGKNERAYYKFYVSKTGSTSDFEEVKIDSGSAGLGDYTENGYLIPGSCDWYVIDLVKPVEVNGDFLVGYSVHNPGESVWLDVSTSNEKSGISFMCSSVSRAGNANDLRYRNAALGLKAYTSNMKEPVFSGTVSGSPVFKFDYHDRMNTERECSGEVTVSVSGNEDMVNLYANSFTLSTSSSEYKHAYRIKTASVSYTPSAGAGTAKLKFKAEKGTASGSYFLAYKGKIISTTPVTVTCSEDKIDTSVSGSAVGYQGSNPVIELKNAYGGAAVTSVAAEGFKDNVIIREVTVPEGFTSIGSKAFSGCTGLEKVCIPDSVTTIAADAFEGCDFSKLVIICSDTVAEKLPEGIQAYSSEAGNGISITAGETLSVDYSSKQIRTGDRLAGFLRVTDDYDRTQVTDLKWIFQTTAGKACSLAKFRNATRSDPTYNLATVSSCNSVEVGSTKSNGLFTGTAVLKAVSVSDSTKVYAECEIYIKPALVKELQVKLPAAGTAPLKQTNGEYVLTLSEGTSYKLPVTAKDGQNKTLVYSTESSDFTVINGTVKAVSVTSSPGEILIYPQDQGENFEKKITVKVNVIKAQNKPVLTADKKSLVLVGDEKRTLTVTNKGGSSQVSLEFKNGENTTDAYELTDAVTGNNNIDGTKTFKIDVLHPDRTAKGDYLEIKANGKTVKVGLSAVNTYQNVTKINEPYAKKLTDGTAEINIAKGQTFNPGVSVLPAAAADNIEWFAATSAGGSDQSIIVSVNKNTVKAVEKGTCYLQGTLTCSDMNSTVIKTKIYKINVYETGGSIEYKDDNYVIAGGILMTREDAEGACTKQLDGGQIIDIKAPETAGSSEEIIWTSSGPAALSIDSSVSGRLKLALIQPGTYTVTGVSKYTKQKISFKVNIKGTDTVESKDDDHLEYCLSGQNVWKESGTGAADGHAENSAIKMNVGSSASLRFISENCADVTYTSTAGKVVSVDAKGTVKVLKASDSPVRITAVMAVRNNLSKSVSREFWIIPEVSPGAVTITPKFQTSAQAGTEITLKAAVKGVSGNVVWSRVKNTGYDSDGNKFGGDNETETDDTVLTDGKLKLNVPAVWPADDKYEVKVKASAAGKTEEYTVTVYRILAASVTVHPEDAVRVKRYGTAGKGLAATNGAADEALHRLTVDLYAGGSQFVTHTDVSGRSVQKKTAAEATTDEITWVSGNTYLATAESVPHVSGHCDKDDPYGQSLVITANNKGYTGTVIFTGTFRNSGRKISVRVNII